MKYAMISGATSKALRRIITSDDPNYDYTIHLGPGEQIQILDQVTPLIIDEAHPLIVGDEVIGPPLESAVVDASMLVVSIIKANPELDSSPDGQLVLTYSGVFVGCTWDAANNVFVAPIEQHPGGTSPDGTPYPPYQTGGPIPRPPVP